MTDAEKELWYRLRDRQLGVRFRRQHPIGPYIVDFAAPTHFAGGEENTATSLEGKVGQATGDPLQLRPNPTNHR
jgi:hypothetical protein